VDGKMNGWGCSQQSSVLQESVSEADVPSSTVVFLEKVEIHRILEGMFMQQVMGFLSPCFKRIDRSSMDSTTQSNHANIDDLSSPSESIPVTVAPDRESYQADQTIHLDSICSEISSRTGFIIYINMRVKLFYGNANKKAGIECLQSRDLNVDIFLTRKLAVLTTILKNFHSNETCTKREIYYRNERLAHA
jgi:hypothetical protein